MEDHRTDLAIVGGRVYHSGEFRDVALGVTNGTVTQIASPNSTLDAERTLNLDGELVLPGLVDAHVHFREPGYVEKEGVDTGSAAAAAGGVTTVVEMPNTRPPVTNLDRFEQKGNLFESKSHIDFALFGALADENIGDGNIQALVDAGATAFKTFMATSFGPLLIEDKGQLYRAFEEVAAADAPLYIHAEDEEYINEFSRRAQENNIGGMDRFFRSRPPIAEWTAVSDVIDIVRETGALTVIAHVTTNEAVDQIVSAREAGLPINAEVTPYHLAIDEPTLSEIGPRGIGTPPVRSSKNRDRLWEQLNAGSIALIGSDHAPHEIAEKDRSPLDVAPGMPQLETALPLLLNAVNEGRTSVERIVNMYSEHPARLHGLYPRKGSLSVGADADFVIVDMDQSWTVKAGAFESAGAYSPFDGWKLVGKPVTTYQRGKRIAEDMQVLNEPGEGQMILP